MKRAKKVLFLLTAVLTLVVTVKYITQAADSGTQENPLISKDYVDKVLKPEILTSVDQKVSSALSGQNIEAMIDQKINAKLPELPDTGGFQLVSVSRGQKLMGEIGAQIIIRDGGGYVLATYSTDGILNTTTGEQALKGETLAKDQVYIFQRAEERGIYFTTNSLVLVNGKYSLK